MFLEDVPEVTNLDVNSTTENQPEEDKVKENVEVEEKEQNSTTEEDSLKLILEEDEVIEHDKVVNRIMKT